MVSVPAGDFFYGEKKEKRTIVKPFLIGKYLITNAQYHRFVAVTRHRIPFWGTTTLARPYNWDQETGAFPQGKADHPVVAISWNDAQTYCQWLSKETGKEYLLPTEEEWERAARGTDGRDYPWGNEFDVSRCNTRESGIRGTSPVDRFRAGASPCGAFDMAGNVWELTATDYDESRKILRGGCWLINLDYARCASRDRVTHVDFINMLGFRIVSHDP
ncbi:MAG: SUMF1/EgtB/PvdO family nonheme iron enzyme [Anaerolineae bacterium]